MRNLHWCYTFCTDVTLFALVLHLTLKYAQILVLGQHMFLESHSFPQASLSENHLLLDTDTVCGQISEHIFTPMIAQTMVKKLEWK